MTASPTESHRVNSAGYCDFCDERITSQNEKSYCPGRGYYTTNYPRGLKSVSSWKKLGYKLMKGQKAAGMVYAPSLPSARAWYPVYSYFQVEIIKKEVSS